MKKQYTKKQIMESIKYWQKQLKTGNYKKSLNESSPSDLLFDSYDYIVYGEVNIGGSYGGSEFYGLGLSDISITNAIKSLVSMWSEEVKFQFQTTYRPNTWMSYKEFFNSYEFRKYVIKELERNGKTTIECKIIKDGDETEANMTFTYPAKDDDIEYCNRLDAVTDQLG